MRPWAGPHLRRAPRQPRRGRRPGPHRLDDPGADPRRSGGGDSRFPLRGPDEAGAWQGYLTAEEAPRIVNPPEGRLWTANARVVDGPMLAKIGFGDYDRGCRAGMIRDRLRALDKATEADMLAIQLDDRAVFLERWRRLLLDLLTPEAIAQDPRRGELKNVVENWGARAAVGSAGYRLVWEFRLRVVRAVLSPLTARCARPIPSSPWPPWKAKRRSGHW